MKKSPVEAAGGLIIRRNGETDEIALIHRPHYDDWTLPKGKLDPGESAAEAALREVEEETGLRCRLGEVAGRVSYTTRAGRPKVVTYYYMTPEGGMFQANDEADELRWLTPEKASRLLSYEHDRELVDRAARVTGL